MSTCNAVRKLVSQPALTGPLYWFPTFLFQVYGEVENANKRAPLDLVYEAGRHLSLVEIIMKTSEMEKGVRCLLGRASRR